MAYTVLVIDDTRKVLDIIAHFLNTEGYITKTTTDPEEGITIAKAGGINVILLDIMMPKMDGYSVAKILKDDEKTRFIPIIMLTAKSIIMNTPKEFFYGLYGFISKPFTKDQLVRTIKGVMQVTNAEEDTRFLKIIEDEEQEKENPL